MRDKVVYSYQPNRNPCVDHPEWAHCIFENVNSPLDTIFADTFDQETVDASRGAAITQRRVSSSKRSVIRAEYFAAILTILLAHRCRNGIAVCWSFVRRRVVSRRMSSVVSLFPLPPPLAAAAAPTHATDDIRHLIKPTAALPPELSVNAVGEALSRPEYSGLLSLPIVDVEGMPVGSISRFELMVRVFMRPYGRELHGRRPIATLMNTQPLIIAADSTVDAASRFIAENIRQPISDDFIVVDGGGKYLGMGVVLDVLGAMAGRLTQQASDLELANRNLRSSQSQLIQSEKMASLGQMVAGLAHEINTPLGYVKNNVEMTRGIVADAQLLIASYQQVVDAMLAPEPPPAPIFEALVQQLEQQRASCDADTLQDLCSLLDDTVFGVAQIGDLVGNLKDFSRLDKARVEQVDLHKLIESALKIGGNLLRKKNVEIERRFGEIPEVECSPAQINQVLLNLITNAAQAIEHDHGKIVLRTQQVGKHVFLLVEDNGRGIPTDALPRIFDPFFTTKPIGQGTGLGLSICYQIMQDHRGHIRATSVPGQGTRFLVALPQRAVAEQPQASES